MKTYKEIGEDYIKSRNNENRINRNSKWYSEEEVQREKLKVLRDLRDDLQRDIKNLHKKYTEELDLLKYAEISKQQVD